MKDVGSVGPVRVGDESNNKRMAVVVEGAAETLWRRIVRTGELGLLSPGSASLPEDIDGADDNNIFFFLRLILYSFLLNE